MNKWTYIDIIASFSSKSRDLLLEMMELYDKPNLQEITFLEAQEFYHKIKKELNKK